MLALDLAFERIDYLDARPLTPIGSAYRHELLTALQAAIAAQESGHNDADHESLTPVAWLRMLLKDAYPGERATFLEPIPNPTRIRLKKAARLNIVLGWTVGCMASLLLHSTDQRSLLLGIGVLAASFALITWRIIATNRIH